MNKRIQELAEQAGAYFGKAHKDYFGEEHPAFIIAEDMDIEKFAELIVRECVTKMALEVMNNSWIDDAVKNTYEHFGVEE